MLPSSQPTNTTSLLVALPTKTFELFEPSGCMMVGAFASMHPLVIPPPATQSS
jgi:hypothetical protein